MAKGWRWYAGIVGGVECAFEAKLDGKQFIEISKLSLVVAGPQGVGFRKTLLGGLGMVSEIGKLPVSGTALFEVSDEIAQKLTEMWNAGNSGPKIALPTEQEKKAIIHQHDFRPGRA